MTLQEWIDDYGRGAITELQYRCRISTKTISGVAKRGASTRGIAERISEATEGKVSVASLLGIDTAAGA